MRVFFRSLSSRSSRRSATPRSARISSSSIACASRAGSIEPEGCGDGRIPKRAQDVNERVGVLVGHDVDQRLGAAGLAGRREIGEFDGRRHPFLRVVHRRQAIEPRVGHFRDADRRFALAVGRPRGFPGAGHQLKQGGLPAGTEAYEGRSEHDKPSHRTTRGDRGQMRISLRVSADRSDRGLTDPPQVGRTTERR